MLYKKENGCDRNETGYLIVATREGIIKRGMEEARSAEIETLSQVIVRKATE